jgi:hypothetical protein
MARRVYAVESVKGISWKNEEGVMKRITVVVLRELVIGSKITGSYM